MTNGCDVPYKVCDTRHVVCVTAPHSLVTEDFEFREAKNYMYISCSPMACPLKFTKKFLWSLNQYGLDCFDADGRLIGEISPQQRQLLQMAAKYEEELSLLIYKETGQENGSDGSVGDIFKLKFSGIFRILEYVHRDFRLVPDPDVPLVLRQLDVADLD